MYLAGHPVKTANKIHSTRVNSGFVPPDGFPLGPWYCDQDAKQGLHSWAARQGFALSFGTQYQQTKKQGHIRYFKCHRFSAAKESGEGVWDRVSQGTECKCKVVIEQSKDGYVLKGCNLEHNHELCSTA